LVEILVVLVVMGIAAAIIVPRVSTMGDIQVASVARTILANMQYAQNEAIVTQRPTTVTFDTTRHEYELTDVDGVVLTHPVTKASFVVAFPGTRGTEKVRIVSANFGGTPQVTFDSLGSPDNGGEVSVEADGHTYRIIVAPVTGKISVANDSGASD